MLPSFEAGLVPETHHQAAEEVRAHLVAIRGGAPFLSPTDARLLVTWLDEGVAVTAILLAIERAADTRRKARSRLPLTLSRCKAHLGKAAKPSRLVPPPAPAGHPFAQIAHELDRRGATQLAEQLSALPTADAESLVRAGLAAARTFLARLWDDMQPADRTARLDRARDELLALDLGYDDEDLDFAAEELARDELRRTWPMLEAAVLWDHVRRAEPR